MSLSPPIVERLSLVASMDAKALATLVIISGRGGSLGCTGRDFFIESLKRIGVFGSTLLVHDPILYADAF